ncbi:hypothetical protein C8A00DRAFT_14187 [Chaetomidium leptoderma]|uniref:Uncharacterized protein n=1 Tax=Chaetomidium leptoderma TaxID=669021 RepID=A0AAN6VP41_9PEZI|nr:hypothetical protein C8A00DRAFT_14187 [Chaetomidium leptoderma]
MDELRGIPSPGYCGGIWRQPRQDLNFIDGDLNNNPQPDNAISWSQGTDRGAVAQGHLVLPRLEGRFIGTGHHYTIFTVHKPVFSHRNLYLGTLILHGRDCRGHRLGACWVIF